MTEASHGSAPRSSYVLFALAVIAAAIAIAIAISGGFSMRLFGVRVSSHGVLRPALLALLFLAIAYRRMPQWQRGTISNYLARVLRAATGYVAPAAAVAVLVLCWVYGTRAAGGSDSYGYVSQARLWLGGELHVDQSFVAAVPWPNADWTFTPLGYRPAPDHTIVPTYAPGLPLLMVLFMKMTGDCGAFVVTPLSGAILVLMTFALGVQVSGRVTGALAALLTFSSPTILFMTLWPMSDVPAAAFWMMSLVMAARRPSFTCAALSASAAGVAILIRPNLAPLAVFPTSLVIWRATDAGSRFAGSQLEIKRRAQHVLAFALACLPFIALVAWVNHDLYGSFLTSGYGDASSIYKWQNLRPNLERYPRWLWESQGAYVFVFPLAAVIPSAKRTNGLAVRWILLAYIVGVFACYLFYAPFDDWWYLRFVIPAMPVMFVLSIDAIWRIGRRLGPGAPAIATIAFTVFSVNHAMAYARSHSVFEIGEGEQKYADVGRYLARELPPETTVVAGLHSGNIRLYAQLRTLRVDVLDGAWLDRAIDYLKSIGPAPYLVLEESEVQNFRQRFANQRAVALVDRPAVAVHSRNVYVFSTDFQRSADSPQTIPHTSGCE
jgi:heme/copper-type cytochrome/quinol oxidase subunit 4